MACNFTIPFSGSPQAVLDKATAAIQSQGGTFTGNDSGGAFNVNVMGNTIAGSFLIAGQTLDVTISSKPFFVPCSAIEGFLKTQLS